MSGSGTRIEHPLRAPGEMQPMQDQPRLDRLAEPDFIREQHARQRAAPSLRPAMNIWCGIRSTRPPTKPRTGDCRIAAAPLQRLHAQIESREVIDLPGEQPILRFAES